MEVKAQGVDLRESMPSVARLVDHQRKVYGAKYVDDIIARAIAGEADLFYAFEAGHVLGTPFRACAVSARLLELGVVLGRGHAMAMAPPERIV